MCCDLEDHLTAIKEEAKPRFRQVNAGYSAPSTSPNALEAAAQIQWPGAAGSAPAAGPLSGAAVPQPAEAPKCATEPWQKKPSQSKKGKTQYTVKPNFFLTGLVRTDGAFVRDIDQLVQCRISYAA
jgi:hypothetical protein